METNSLHILLVYMLITAERTLGYVSSDCTKINEPVKVSTNNYYNYNPITCSGTFGKNYTKTLNVDEEYIFVYKTPSENKENLYPPRITVESINADPAEPLLVVVTQLKSILSWQIPLGTDGPSGPLFYKRVSRTLCPQGNGSDTTIVSLSTRSNTTIHFSLKAIQVKDFNIKVSKDRYLTVTPSEPQFFKYDFEENATSALLNVNSDSDACMTLSIQNYSCPVYDLETTVQYHGLYQTVLHKGGIFLRKEEFPFGLFVVFVAHSTNRECTGKDSNYVNHAKTLSFKLEKSISFMDYMIAVSAVIGVFVFIYMTAICFIIYSNKRSTPNYSIAVVPPPILDAASIQYGVGSSYSTTPTTPMFPGGGGCSDDGDNLSETDVDMLYDADSSIEIKRTKQVLFLSDLAQKDPRALSMKSRLFLWNMLIVAVFYALPVVQLVFTYQKVLISSGNQDLCYYNFLCSHRLGYLSDFNHVFSNIGYCLFGLLFLGLTYRRQKLCYSVGHHLGIPYHYGLFYALGVALCMEGVLSACYHLCPNHSNFQFDTSFMYVLSVLSMIKIYQIRHPDITASAYTTFGVLAFVIFLGMFGVLDGSRWFYVAFTVAHLLTCFVVTAQIYHVGTWKFDFGMFSRFWNTLKNDYIAGGLRYSCRPMYPARMVLLFLANIGNWALVAIGYYINFGDFATYMLSIFLANLMMYFIFYIVMKLVVRETILWPPLIYIVLSFLFWAAGLYFFYHKSISWKKTPSESRSYNQPCEILNFYDKHDIWHFLSAGALFFSFMVLLTLDDDIAMKDRRVIPVF